MLVPSSDLPPGAVLTRRLMGEDVVVYRTRSGRARVIRPYCPHLGAHLGCGGRVEDDLIVCPFHSFAFSGDGSLARVGRPHCAARTGQTHRAALRGIQRWDLHLGRHRP
ncbi:Rieske 2Fe-2S domain-containing protein [Streptomyces sp. NPDC059256]|uniref:Rieske 2Fe-2S domain-containing protein n=1 Tax=Streptomyces sp. NPDC059256 TaxID=3346794 RepID=UPI0036C797AD